MRDAQDAAARVASPLRGIYLVRNKYLFGALALSDALLRGMRALRRRPSEVTKPVVSPCPRILVANAAHMGDAILLTAVLPALHEMYPGCSIGVLVGSWSRPVIGGHPLVSRVHVADHWVLNRADRSFWKRIRRYVRTRATAMREIRAARYDVAIDLYFHFPNFIPLLWQAGIPVRAGYTSAGFGPLLTVPTKWRQAELSVVDYHTALLKSLGVQLREHRYLPNLPRGASATLPSGVAGQRYIVLHAGTGSAQKRWPLSNWKTLAQELEAAGHLIVFTGSGQDEAAQVREVSAELTRFHDLCDALDWSQFVSVVANAMALVGVDSVAGHVAAAFGVPTVVISSGINDLSLWHPVAVNSTVLSYSVPCAPCYRSRGCAEMTCVRGVRVVDVVRALDDSLTVPS